MEKINATIKKWGNSFGIILPKEIVNTENLKEGNEIEVLISSKNKTRAKDIFGILKGRIKKDTAELLKEVDRDFEGDE